MHTKISIKSVIILIIATILTVPSSTLQLLHAQSDTDLEKTVLSIHNQERAAVNVPSLTWSTTLADNAQQYANYLTTLGLTLDDKAPHSQFNIDNHQGENLWMGTKGVYSNAERVQWFADEKSNYNGDPIKD